MDVYNFCMGRKRTVPDAEVIAATLRVVSRMGPHKLTLGEVAGECGLAAATLVQRYGSKRGLLLAVAEAGAGGMDECFAQLRTRHRSPLAALFASFEMMTSHGRTPEELANSLAFFQMDLTDPDFHKLCVKGAKEAMAGTRQLLDEAVAAGELAGCDTRRLARLLHAASSGSMLNWAILREGRLSDWLRKDLDMLMGPYRVKTRRSPGRHTNRHE